MAGGSFANSNYLRVEIIVPLLILVTVFAWNVMGSDGWLREDVGTVGSESSVVLAYDRSGTLNIVYESNDGSLYHATRNGNSWSTDYVTKAPWPINLAYLTMRFDTQDRIHISAGSPANDSILYAVGEPGDWAVSEFRVPELGSSCMVLDGGDDAHILCMAYSIRYDVHLDPHYQPVLSDYSWNGSNWTNTTVRSYPEGSRAQLACAETDSLGTIHALIMEDPEPWSNIDHPVLLSHMGNPGGVWSFDEVLRTDHFKGSGEIGGVSMALEDSGNVHAACYYYEGEEYSIKYANNTGGIWTNSTVAVGGNIWPVSTSVALDSVGHAFIGYYYGFHEIATDQYHHSYQLADNADGSWNTRTMDTHELFGWDADTSIAVDEEGGVHIAYVSSPNPWCHLTYATNAEDSLMLMRALLEALTYALVAAGILAAVLIVVKYVRMVTKRRELDRKEMEETLGLFEK